MYASVLVGLAVTLGAPGTKDAPKKEPPSIVGEWQAEKLVRGGQEAPKPPGGVTVTFTADGKVKVVEGGKEKDEHGTYKLDAKKTPAEIDLMPPKDEGPLHGIFKIDGDTLTICLADKGSDRPTKFESPEGSKIMLLTLKREKK